MSIYQFGFGFGFGSCGRYDLCGCLMGLFLGKEKSLPGLTGHVNISDARPHPFSFARK